jgi:hypothetical protein
MTLKEKFKKLEVDKEIFNNCEKIADEFAIGFAEWCLDENHIILNDGKELLEIYKKEKGL